MTSESSSLEPEQLSFGEAFDWYGRTMYDADAVAENLASTLRSVKARRVLDCAAGSGMPALQLHQKYGTEDGRLELDDGDGTDSIVELACSDGSLAMVQQFNYNAKSLGIEAHCELRDWLELDPSAGPYDFILCRGNSLIYATTWDGGDAVADLGGIEDCLRSFAASLEPGGYLQVDAPKHLKLDLQATSARRTYEEYIDAAVNIVETVRETATGRHWECAIEVYPNDGCTKRLEFGRHSAKLTIDDVAELLAKVGFDPGEPFQPVGDRRGHETLLARYRP